MTETAPARRQRRYDPNRREHIAEAAIRVVAEVGVDNLSLRAVAREADVPVGSISYHFENKDELIRAALELASTQSTTFVEAVFARADPRDDLADALSILLEEYTVRQRALIDLELELFLAPRRRPSLIDSSGHWNDAFAAFLTQYASPIEAQTLSLVVQAMLVEAVATQRSYTAAQALPIFRQVLST